jgi:hypothetical protein
MSWTIEPHSSALLVTRAVGQFVLPSFYPFNGYLHVLAGIVIDVVQMVYYICHKSIVGPSLSGDASNIRSLGRAVLYRISSLLGSNL